MKNPLVWIVILVLAAAAAWYLSVRQDQAQVDQAVVTPPPVAAAPEPERYPVEEIRTPSPEPDPSDFDSESTDTPAPEPLPALSESDPEVLAQAAALSPALESLLIPEFVLSRVVATVDALDGRRVAPPMRPTTSVPGRFRVLEAGDDAVISPENAERYAPFVAVIENLDTDQLVALYLRYYPLLQEAYTDLDKDDDRFNDRVVEILDLLLATPEPVGLIEVKQNEAVYEFVDPELESLAVGQKALLRLSQEQRQVVKDRLRALRSALAGQDDAQ
jgi:hypothetical protein